MKERINGLMEEYMRVNGFKIRCTGGENFHGLMERPMRENTLRIRKKDMEFSLGLMGDSSRELGKMVDNMELE